MSRVNPDPCFILGDGLGVQILILGGLKSTNLALLRIVLVILAKMAKNARVVPILDS